MKLGRLLITNGPTIMDSLRALAKGINDNEHLEIGLKDDDETFVATMVFDVSVTPKTLTMAFKVLNNEGTIMGQVKGKQKLRESLVEDIESKYIELMYQMIDENGNVE